MNTITPITRRSYTRSGKSLALKRKPPRQQAFLAGAPALPSLARLRAHGNKTGPIGAGGLKLQCGPLETGRAPSMNLGSREQCPEPQA